MKLIHQLLTFLIWALILSFVFVLCMMAAGLMIVVVCLGLLGLGIYFGTRKLNDWWHRPNRPKRNPYAQHTRQDPS